MKNSNYIKLFFEPFVENKKYPLIFLTSVLTGLLLVILNVQFFKELLVLIENKSAFSEILKIGGIILGIIIFGFLMEMGFLKIGIKVEWIFKNFLTKKYLKKYLLLDNEEVDKIGTGKFIGIIKTGIDEWVEMLNIALFGVVGNIGGFVVNLILISFINIKLLLPAILMSILIVLGMSFTKNQTVEFRNEKKKIFNEIMRNYVKVISEKFTIIKNNKITLEIEKILHLNGNFFKKSMGVAVAFNFFMSGSAKILAIAEVLLIVFIGYLILEGEGTFADVGVVMMVIGLMKGYLGGFVYNFIHLTGRMNGFTNLIETLYGINEIKGYEKGKDFIYKKGEFELKNISFSYKKGLEIFKNFSLKISGGKKTAIIGRSGSGKSTIIKVLMGFVRSQKGEVFIDGQNIENFSLKTFYKYIGYLSQNPGVFDGTVLENLTYGVEDLKKISDKNIKEVLKLAECDFVFSLDKGLKTEIGEKGVRLSGGERQRLAIARLFLQDPEIIILDEPTSALDSISEDKISTALNNLSEGKRGGKGKRTMIVIAHRLQTVVDSDEIIVLGKNEILEKGNHKELLGNKGFYFEMVDLQSGKIG